MTTQFPHLSTCLDIKQSKHYPDKVGMMDRRTIRTRDCVAGILLLSDLCKDNPDFEGKLFGRIATHREDIVSGIDFRIYSGTGHLMDIDFTMDRSRFLGKVGHKKPSDTKKIALIDGTILLGIAHEAERICYTNPAVSKADIIATIPTLKSPKKRIVITLS